MKSKSAACHLRIVKARSGERMGSIPKASIFSSILKCFSLTPVEDAERALMYSPHKVLGIQDGIQRLNLQQVSAIHILHTPPKLMGFRVQTSFVLKHLCDRIMSQPGRGEPVPTTRKTCTRTDAWAIWCRAARARAGSAIQREAGGSCCTSRCSHCSPGRQEARHSSHRARPLC